MPEDLPAKTAPRPWLIVAAEVATELDPAKLLKLVEELNRALEEQHKLNVTGRAQPEDSDA